MNIPRHLLRTPVIWKRLVGRNEYGEPQFESREIRVRWDDERKLIRDQHGAEIVSNAVVITRHIINPGDQLRFRDQDWPVIAVKTRIDLTGRLSHRELVL